MAASTTSNQTRFWRDRSPYPGRPSSPFSRRTSDKRVSVLQDHGDVWWKHFPGSQERNQPTLRAEEPVTHNSGRDSTSAAPNSTMSSQRTDPMDIFEPYPIRNDPTPSFHDENELFFGKSYKAKPKRQRPQPLFGSLNAMVNDNNNPPLFGSRDDMVSDNKDHSTASESRPTTKRSISWAHGCSPADQKAEKLTRERSSSLPPPSHESEDEVATPMAVTPGSQQTRSTDLVNHKSELSSSPPRKWLQLDDMISGPRLVQVKPGPGYDDLPPLTYVTTDPGVVDSIPPLDAATQALALDDLRDYVSSSCSSSRASRSPSPEREEIIEKDDWETDDGGQVTEDEDDETESELEWVQRVETREPGRMVRLLNGKCIPHSKWKKKHQHGRKSNWGMVLIVSMLVVLLALFVAYMMNLAWCEGIAGRT
ncbi:hypothetical protein CGLO_02232 [Colletotrichum gloeosporioides Cg-14]|uniref:Uncharacterized protein n=1 Tax=Colletotrichum gloeosporioides (strain Cg-14) TaxID=1237896 RepID=T0M9E1_COLGC|nr:hypothetical protein CGLO_02232 [Colletotrichum gloeosporioides Cg-14]